MKKTKKWKPSNINSRERESGRDLSVFRPHVLGGTVTVYYIQYTLYIHAYELQQECPELDTNPLYGNASFSVKTKAKR